MKIEYIKLKNFSNISSSFKSEEISIDFRECINKIILLTGPNGSGKTSILSCIHPFATNGNLDVRNDNPLVLVGKEGYKEIWIKDDVDEYIIKHYYFPNKESHSVKSYIEKNGDELNPNGNVTSFKEIVHQELDIEMDYLKLTRLGSNVTNFIDLKTTERKSFMGKILDEVDIYLKCYKKITQDMREVKSIISHLVDKISKLSIGDIDEVKGYQDKLKHELDDMKRRVEELTGDLSIIQYEIGKYDSPIIVKENLDITKKEMQKIEKIISKTGNDSISLESCEDELNLLEKQNVQYVTQLDALKTKRSELLNSYDRIIRELDEVKKEISKVSNSEELKSLENMINELRNTIQTRSIESNLAKFEYKISKQELNDLIVDLDRCTEMIQTAYEFGMEPIKRALEYITNGSDISEYVKMNRDRSEKDKLQNAAEVVYNYLITKLNPSKEAKEMASTCHANCFANMMYDEFLELVTEHPDTVIEDETFITYTKMAYQTMLNVLDIIKSNKDIIKKLPAKLQESFLMRLLIENIENMRPIYPKSELYEELSKSTDYELQQKDLETLNNLKMQFKLMEKSIGNTDYLETQETRLESDLNSTKDNISEVSNEIDDITSSKLNTDVRIGFLRELKDSLTKKEEVSEHVHELETVYETLRSLSLKNQSVMSDYQLSQYQYNKAEKEYNDIEYRLKSYETLNEELSKYNKTYDEMELVKSAVSSKEGIPLLYIQIYLKNIQEITNDLLDIIYGDELYIEDFNITADEFKIPYTTKGVEIRDVCYASQGEKSFISLALSFALIYQSISKYNIMLLDEIDATLDTKNREKFLQILEKQMNMIDGEQIFVISHNNMFNMYPVSIIDLKNREDPDNKLAQYIKIDVK